MFIFSWSGSFTRIVSAKYFTDIEFLMTTVVSNVISTFMHVAARVLCAIMLPDRLYNSALMQEILCKVFTCHVYIFSCIYTIYCFKFPHMRDSDKGNEKKMEVLTTLF